VIVSFHGGGEGTEYEHVSDSVEIFKGENRGNLRLLPMPLLMPGPM
jgi:hypothetical protein